MGRRLSLVLNVHSRPILRIPTENEWTVKPQRIVSLVDLVVLVFLVPIVSEAPDQPDKPDQLDKPNPTNQTDDGSTYPSLARIPVISACESARKVWVRILPKAPMLAWSATMDASSGASKTPTLS